MPDTIAAATRRPFPDSGTAWPALEATLTEAKQSDIDWRNGKLAVYTYYRDDALLRVAQDAYALYFSENALGKRAFPSLARLETELVEMGLSLFEAPPGAGGTFTSGGTESIFLAVLAARNAKPVRGRPNIVACETLHATFNKAASFLGLDVVRTPMGTDFRADPAAIAAAIDENTVMLAASAPGYSHGVFDPIAAIGAVAQQRGMWFHVDACVGGFLAPFWRELGEALPDFDFRVPGVTSLSADLHKYGYAAKGASLVLLRDAALKRHHTFEFDAWPRGTYATETFSGTRPGGSIAAAWAMVNHLGREGYREHARLIMDAKTRLVAGIESIPGLEVVRPSDLCMLLYRSTDPALDLDALAERLGTRGWFVGRNVRPKAIHLALNTIHATNAQAYIADVSAAAAEVRDKSLRGTEDFRTY
ncbi:aspartate aminotransferase family protein [Roseomonas aerophila]|uniref:Aspartate aminotransferase family protein n=1 Tax=Teichococcus aerophilus TaxID=1224513 RepID=A0ABR7RM95_9PROT|nr:aspartate aminotransferase family protein [Pseudoroseomonas aerophila]MBC9207416.1 aspartate aminotransferase family protein [Pseudoroseomonas aerophila]